MLEYLKQYNISLEQWDLIEANLSDSLKTNLEEMANNVQIILDYFKNLGVKNLANIIIYRPDLCFKNKEDLEEKIEKIDKELLKFVIDNNIDDLISLDI